MQLSRLSRRLLLIAMIGAAHADYADASDDEANARHGRCSNADLRGTYGFSANGMNLNGAPLPPGLLGPFASAGSAVYDGEGNVSLSAIASFNGALQPAAASGTYEVGPDCLFTSSLDNGTSFLGVIADGGRELFILQTTPFTAIAGSAEKQRSGLPRAGDLAALRQQRCTSKTIRGTHAFIAQGFAAPPTVPPEAAGPLAGVGTVEYDADGSFLLKAQRSVSGTLDPAVLPLGGRYQVEADCGITMAFDVGFHFSGVIVDGGREIRFVETDPGTTLIVKTRRF